MHLWKARREPRFLGWRDRVVVGSVVIVIGVTFVSFLIATVTSYFVAVEEARRKADIEGGMADALRQIERRLERIETKLEG